MSPSPSVPLLGFTSPTESCVQPGSVLLDVRRVLGPFVGLERVPSATGPLHLATKVHSPLERVPFRVFASSSPAGPRRRFDSLRFRVPSTTSLGLAPSGSGCPHPARFRSQVFATSQRFPGTPELCGLVPCRCRPWDPPPSELSPHRGSPAPLGAACSLAVIHSRAETHRTSPFAARFRRRLRFHAVAWFPLVTMDFLSTGRSLLPGRPGFRAAESPRSASFTCFEAFLPSLSPFTAALGCPAVAGRCSPGLPAPPKLSLPHLGSSTRPDPKVCARALVRRLGLATWRTSALQTG